LATATAGVDIGLPHVDAALEDLLPGTIGEIPLEKFSQPLSSWVASSQGGEKTLYAPWLVRFGTTPDAVDIAISADLTYRENFNVRAIKVPGATADALTSAFADVARQAGWTVASKSIALKTELEITDPTAKAAGLLGVAYVYAKNDVMYTVVTDDSSLLLEALIKLP
jgi:hypothetical protein